MRTKIFLAFIAVIISALLSNIIFEWLIIKDFDSYINGVKADRFYWILASVEGSRSNGKWDKKALSEAIHWAMMFDLYIKVLDAEGREILSSAEVMESLSDAMKQKMHGLAHIHRIEGPLDEHPLYSRGEIIGIMLYRQMQKEPIKEKEFIFKKRTKNFLLVSLIITGCGLLLMALLFSRLLSRPITNLKKAAEGIAKGDFNIRTEIKNKDEVGELSEAFNRMAESLQREAELRERLMSNIAHELRTPLTIMKSQAEAITDGVIDREKGVENISSSIERLIKLVKGIEDITAAETSFFAKSETTEINLGEFLKGIAQGMLPAFKEKGLSLDISDKRDIIIATDEEKLEKIVGNILSNSLKYTETGGVDINYGINEKSFFVEIKDSGKGIPESELDLIFTRFYRIEKRGDSGLGLGLAIVKELIAVMGGSIDVKSRIGEGTVFRISLPNHPLQNS
jgi:two-component system sensor histidine kinase BaeS